MSYSHINTSDHKKVSELSLSLSGKWSKGVSSMVAAIILSGCGSPHVQVIQPRDNGVPQTYYGNTPRIVTPLSYQQEQELRRLNEKQQMIEQENAAREHARKEQVRREREYHEHLRREQAARDRALREQWEREKRSEDKRHHHDYRGTPNREYREPRYTLPTTPYNSVPKKRIPYDPRNPDRNSNQQ